jgi:DNA-binding transcriptional LysR family regulator
MELSDLNVFQEVARSGGITAAAQKLNRVPSNVTARIQKLEEELGTPLFLRERNRLRISPSGQQLLPYAQQILALSQQAVNELQQDQPSGTLSIGAMEAVAATRLTPPLVKFHSQHKGVELQVKTGPTGLLIEQVLSGELNMALVADPAQDPRLHIEPAFEEELVLVSNLSHPAIKSPKDLDVQGCLLGFNHKCAYRTRLCEWAQQQGILAKVVEISSYHALLSCVAAGMGVGIVPKALLENYPFIDQIQCHRLPKKWHQTRTALIWRKDASTPAIEAFSSILLNEKTSIKN